MPAKKSRASAPRTVTILLLAAAVLYLIFGFTASAIFGPDNIFTANIPGAVSFEESDIDVLPAILRSLTCAIYLIGGSMIVCRIIKLIAGKIGKSEAISGLFCSVVKCVAWVVLILYVLTQFGVDTATLLASAGILTLIIGLAAQGIIEDLLAGLFIIFTKTFNVGDIIVIDGFRGRVSEIGIRTTKLTDVGGDMKIVNNSAISEIINMTCYSSVAVCNFNVSCEVPLTDIEDILEKNRERVKKEIPAITNGPVYKGISSFGAESVEVEVVAYCNEADKFQVLRDMNRIMKIIFDENEISIHGGDA